MPLLPTWTLFTAAGNLHSLPEEDKMYKNKAQDTVFCSRHMAMYLVIGNDSFAITRLIVCHVGFVLSFVSHIAVNWLHPDTLVFGLFVCSLYLRYHLACYFIYKQNALFCSRVELLNFLCKHWIILLMAIHHGSLFC